MDYPQEKVFRRMQEEKSKLKKIRRSVQWILALSSLAFLIAYFFLIAVWCVLGAILNPSLFLPYASGAITFITFMATKALQFKNLGKQGRQAVLDYLKKMTSGVMNKVLNVLTNRIEGASRYVADEAKSIVNGPIFNDITKKLSDFGVISEQEVKDVKSKIMGLDSSMIVSAANSVAQNPQNIVDFVDDVVDNMKDQVVQKMRDECVRKGIPEKLIDFTLAILEKNLNKARSIAEGILAEELAKKGLTNKNYINLLLELLHPSSIKFDEFSKYAFGVIVDMLMKKLEIKEEDEASENLIKILDLAANLFHLEMENFLEGLVQLPQNAIFKKAVPPSDFLNGFFMALYNLSINNYPTSYIEPIQLMLRDLISFLRAKNKIDDKAQVFFTSLLEILTQFTEIYLPGYPVSKLSKEEFYAVIKDFTNTFKPELKEDKDKSYMKVGFYLSYAIASGELFEFPKEFLNDVGQIANYNDTTNIEACIKLLNLVYYKAYDTSKAFDKLAEKYSVDEEISEFLRFSYSYFEMTKSELLDLRKAMINNKIFKFVAQKLRLTPNELMGLIDFLYMKFKSPYVPYLYKYLMQKLKLSKDIIKQLQPLIELIICEDDEDIVLSACKKLGIPDPILVLISKKLVNPGLIYDEMLKRIDKNNLRDTVYNSPDDEYANWKKKLCKNIDLDSQLNEDEKDYYKFLFGEWNATSYNSQKVYEILNIIAKFHKLDKKKITKSTLDGAIYYNGVEFLIRILQLRKICIQSRGYLKSIIKYQNTIKQISEDFALKEGDFKAFLDLFICFNDNPINFLRCFVPKNLQREYEINTFGKSLKVIKSLTHSVIKRQAIIQDSYNFIDEFCDNFSSRGISLPRTVIRKFVLDTEFFDLSSLFEFVQFFVHHEVLENSEDKNIFSKIFAVAKAARGCLDWAPIKEHLNIQSEFAWKFLEILGTHDPEERVFKITELFDEDNNIFTIVSMFIYIKLGNIKISVPGEKNKRIEQNVIDYLSNEFQIYPEAFKYLHTFNIKDMPEFLEEFGFAMIRRLSGKSLIDENLIRTISGLILGRPFDPSYLAQKLNCSESVITFLITISRLAIRSYDLIGELIVIIEESEHISSILAKLGINKNEFLSLVKLITGHFGPKDIEEVLRSLPIGEDKLDIQVGLCLCKEFDEYSEYENCRFEVQQSVNVVQSSGIFNDYNYDKANIAAVFRIVAGNYLVLKSELKLFSWAIPRIPNSGSAIRNLTMGLSGLLNPRVMYSSHCKVDSTFSQSAKGFYKLIFDEDDAPKSFVKLGEPEFPMNNTIEHAIALFSNVTGIPINWTLLFFLDIFSYEQLKVANRREVLLMMLAFNLMDVKDIVQISTQATLLRLKRKSGNEDIENENQKLSDLVSTKVKDVIDQKHVEKTFLNSNRLDNIYYWKNQYTSGNFLNYLKESQNRNDQSWFANLFTGLFKDCKKSNDHRSEDKEIEIICILSLVRKLRIEQNDEKYLLTLNELLKSIERLLFMENLFHRLARERILRILTLSKPLIINDKKIEEEKNLYSEEYREKMLQISVYTLAIKSGAFQPYTVENVNQMKAKINKNRDEILAKGIEFLSESLKSENILRLKVLPLPEKDSSIFAPLKQKYFQDFEKELKGMKGTTITSWKMDRLSEELTKKNSSDKKFNFYGLSNPDDKPFIKALLHTQVKDFLTKAYGPTNYNEDVGLTESIIKIHLRYYTEVKISREELKSLLEPWNKILTSNDSRLEDIIYVMMSKQGVLPEIESFLNLDNTIISVIFSNISSYIMDENQDGILGTKLNLEKADIQRIEILLDLFTLNDIGTEKIFFLILEKIPKFFNMMKKNSTKGHNLNFIKNVLGNIDFSKRITFLKYPSENEDIKLSDCFKDLSINFLQSLKEEMNDELDRADTNKVDPIAYQPLNVQSNANSPRNDDKASKLDIVFKIIESMINHNYSDIFDIVFDDLIDDPIHDRKSSILDFIQMIKKDSEAIKTFEDEFYKFRGLLFLASAAWRKSVKIDFDFDLKSREEIPSDKKVEEQKISKSEKGEKIFILNARDIMNIFKKSELFEGFFAHEKLTEIIFNFFSGYDSYLEFDVKSRPLYVVITCLNHIFENDVHEIEEDIINLIKYYVEPDTQELAGKDQNFKIKIPPFRKILALKKDDLINLLRKKLNDILDGKWEKKVIKKGTEFFIHIFNGEFFNTIIDALQKKIPGFVKPLIRILFEIIHIANSSVLDEKKLSEYFNELMSEICKEFDQIELLVYIKDIGEIFNFLVSLSLYEEFDKRALINSIVTLLKRLIDLYFDSRNETQSKKAEIDVAKEIITYIASIFTSEKFYEIDGSKVVVSLGDKLNPEDLISFLTTKILPLLFKQLRGHEDMIDAAFTIFKKLKNIDLSSGLRDPKVRYEIFTTVYDQTKFLKLIPEEVDKIICGLEECFNHFRNKKYDEFLLSFIKLLPIDSAIKQGISRQFNEVKHLFDFKLIKSSIQDLRKASKNLSQNPDQWMMIIQKIKEGSASKSELYKVIAKGDDKEGVSQLEFKTLANRLGVRLSDHRVAEIFAKVKSGGLNKNSLCLNEEEFDHAMDYLQIKSLIQTLGLLGITPEMLGWILVKLTILLLLILIFIYFGINAFAFGGTFGAIVNSIFPVVAGVSLGGNNQNDKAKLAEDSIEKNCQKAIKIVQFDNI